MRSRILWALAPVAAALLTGCGAGDRSGEVVTVIETVYPDQGATVTQTMQPQAPAVEAPAVLPAEYVGQWLGHGRGLTLNSDGTGELSLNSGAANNSTYSVIWTGSGSGIAVTLNALTGTYGDGAGDYQPGQTLTGSLGSEGGGQTLTLDSIVFCDDASAQAGTCGA